MAEDQSRIINLFASQKKNTYGIFGVNLYVNGEFKEVVVDDRFPFDETPEIDTWAFAKASSDCEVYVMVLEKAIAKVFGSYEAIEAGKPHQAFMLLTGFPSDIFYSKKTSPLDLWASLLEAIAH
jgi:calpain-15